MYPDTRAKNKPKETTMASIYGLPYGLIDLADAMEILWNELKTTAPADRLKELRALHPAIDDVATYGDGGPSWAAASYREPR